MCADKYFNKNVFECFKEYVYHFIMNFSIVWLGGISKMEDNLSWNQTQLRMKCNRAAKIQNKKDCCPFIVYLYRKLLVEIDAE